VPHESKAARSTVIALGAPLAKVKALVEAAVLKVSAGGFPASPERQKKSPNGKIIIDLKS
jgi:hypothetical protein